MDRDFDEMMGFTQEELKEMVNKQEINKKEQEKILPIMKENYDEYRFSIDAEKQIYNSNICLYFLENYIRNGEIPENLMDENVASDYKKIEKLLNLCYKENREYIVKKLLSEEGVSVEITQLFNPEKKIDQEDVISMLFYLGYLTIVGEEIGRELLRAPNKIMKDLYMKYHCCY